MEPANNINYKQAHHFISNGELSKPTPSVSARKCVVCHRSSSCVCQRCGDYYCSRECQVGDWHRHRYICFPIPALIPDSNRCNIQPMFNEELNLSAADFAPNQPYKNIEQQQRLSPPKTQQRKTRTSSNNDMNSSNVSDRSYKNKKNGNIALRPPLMAVGAWPKEGSQVTITGFRSPNRCCVRSLMAPDNASYLEMLNKVNAYGKHAPILGTRPAINTFAIACFDGNMHRVKILNAMQDIRVAFIDLGCTAVRPLRELHDISEEILSLPQYTVMVQLNGVANYNKTDKIMKYLSNFESGGAYRIHYPDMKNTQMPQDCGATVDLIDWQTDQSLNEKLIKFCSGSDIYEEKNKVKQAQQPQQKLPEQIKKVSKEEQPAGNGGDKNDYQTPSNGSSGEPKETPAPPKHYGPPLRQLQRPVMIPPFKKHIFPETATNIEVVIVDNTCLDYGYIGCIARAHLAKLSEVQTYLCETYIDSKIPYCPKEGEYCVAKYEGEWYRAKVVEIPHETQFTVVYIDFTNESTLTAKDIRRYPSDLQFDCYTNLCLINGLPNELKGEQLKNLRKLLPLQKMLKIDSVKATENDLVGVECRSVLDAMQAFG